MSQKDKKELIKIPEKWKFFLDEKQTKRKFVIFLYFVDLIFLDCENMNENDEKILAGIRIVRFIFSSVYCVGFGIFLLT